jgi:hypothetical protein
MPAIFPFNGWWGRRVFPVPPEYRALSQVKVLSAQGALSEEAPSAERIPPDETCWTMKVPDPIRINSDTCLCPRAHPREGYAFVENLLWPLSYCHRLYRRFHHGTAPSLSTYFSRPKRSYFLALKSHLCNFLER